VVENIGKNSKRFTLPETHSEFAPENRPGPKKETDRDLPTIPF